MRLRVLALLLSGALLPIGGCATRGPKGTRAPTGAPPAAIVAENLSVAYGDTLVVEIYGEKDLSGKFQVSAQGTIDYPLIGRLKVAGLPQPRVASMIRDRLAAGYLRNPFVRVFAEGYQEKLKVFVWGQVSKSGTFPFRNAMTVIEAITLAGGLTPLADRNGIVVTRVEHGKQVRVGAPMGSGQSANLALRAGDVVFVPESVF
ncbi:MAG: polysaccharide biosynthesis/export family protein [Proteobacteria bacterium]|nr:polysaccharide biosynthesis/export family protein [Pseudomonadota bacterium]